MDPIDAAPAEPTALSPMRYPVFRAVWFASILSNFGALIQSVGAAWLMISIAQSADMVALVQASIALPVMLLSLVAGALADNRDRRVVMLGTQVFMLTVSVVLAACAWAGLVTPWLLLLFTFLIGCGSAFNAPAWQASVGDMVPRIELPGAVALNSLNFNIARSTGPAIGGAIVAAAGAAAAFAVNAASYIALIVVLIRWHPVRAPEALPRESLGVAMAAGVRYVSMSPAIRTVLVRSALFGAGASGLTALMPVVARDLHGGGPLVYGLMLGAFGVGAVAGAIGAARLRRAFSTEAIVRVACIAFAIAAAATGLSVHLPTTMAGLLLAGVGWVLALATFNVAVQLSAPRWVVARALSLYQMAAFGGIAGGSWLWGVVAERESIMFSLLACAALLLACAVFGAWRPLAQSTDLDLDPLRHWQEPQTAVPVDPRTGPVVITIEYVIPAKDQLRFLAAMSERRRIRRRDGALNWRLLRDLSDPELWIERYETPTWLDYLRLNNRMTRNDAVIPESLRALHRGPDGPRVRRMIERPAAAPYSARAAGPENAAIAPTEAADARTMETHISPKEMTEHPMAELPQIYLTQNDADRLLRLVETQPGKPFEKLESELVRANVVPREEIPGDVVTMNSRVLFENETTGERREVTLVYPGSADIDAGKISVLVPIGTALLGLRIGQSIDWELPGGEKQRFRIVDVPFQPEAAGEAN